MSAKIFVIDKFDPESVAMMQALYSRSADSVEKHINKVKELGSSKFMESYYIDYGHQSIGDCGTVTIFIEGVSILAAKAIQDNPMYNGQETSTRYIDFSNQVMIDPIGNDLSKIILDNWIKFYTEMTPKIRHHLMNKFPITEGQDETVYNKAINARGFDILRGFLPAGVTTQLSWHTNLRQARDKLEQLKRHPLKEVRQISRMVYEDLRNKYPSSFPVQSNMDEIIFNEVFARDIHYSAYHEAYPTASDKITDMFSIKTDVNFKELFLREIGILVNRPKGIKLPKHLKRYGHFTLRFLIDYGSFRDLQRHRNGLCRIPLLTEDYGMNQWYLNKLPPSFDGYVNKFLEEQFCLINELKSKVFMNEYNLQYYLPMGLNVAVELVYDLPQLVYVTELRTSPFVHPTVRNVMLKVQNYLRQNLFEMALYCNLDLDPFDIRRGKQDIMEK